MKDNYSENEFVIHPDDLDVITEDEYEELEKISEEYSELYNNFEDDLDDVLERINNTSAYEKLGVELHIDIEYLYSFDNRE